MANEEIKVVGKEAASEMIDMMIELWLYLHRFNLFFDKFPTVFHSKDDRFYHQEEMQEAINKCLNVYSEMLQTVSCVLADAQNENGKGKRKN